MAPQPGLDNTLEMWKTHSNEKYENSGCVNQGNDLVRAVKFTHKKARSV